MDEWKLYCDLDPWMKSNGQRKLYKYYLSRIQPCGVRLLNLPCIMRKLTSTSCPSSYVLWRIYATHQDHNMCRPRHITIKFNVSAHNNLYRCNNTFLFICQLPQTWKHDKHEIKITKNTSQEWWKKMGKCTFRTHGTHRNCSNVNEEVKRVRNEGRRRSNKML